MITEKYKQLYTTLGDRSLPYLIMMVTDLYQLYDILSYIIQSWLIFIKHDRKMQKSRNIQAQVGRGDLRNVESDPAASPGVWHTAHREPRSGIVQRIPWTQDIKAGATQWTPVITLQRAPLSRQTCLGIIFSIYQTNPYKEIFLELFGKGGNIME